MDPFYFAAMLVGVAWITVWGALPRPYSGPGWWPFDMAEEGMVSGGVGDTPVEAGPGARDDRPPRPSWRDRSPDPSADPQRQRPPPRLRALRRSNDTPGTEAVPLPHRQSRWRRAPP